MVNSSSSSSSSSPQFSSPISSPHRPPLQSENLSGLFRSSRVNSVEEEPSDHSVVELQEITPVVENLIEIRKNEVLEGEKTQEIKGFSEKIKTLARSVAGGVVSGFKFIAEHKKALFVTAVIVALIALTIFSFGAGLIPMALLPTVILGGLGVGIVVADSFIQGVVSKTSNSQATAASNSKLKSIKRNSEEWKILKDYILKNLKDKQNKKVYKKLKAEALEKNPNFSSLSQMNQEEMTDKQEYELSSIEVELKEAAAKRIELCVDEMMKEGDLEKPSPAGQIQACIDARKELEKLKTFEGTVQEKNEKMEEIRRALHEVGIQKVSLMEENLDEAIKYIGQLESNIFNSETVAKFTAKMLVRNDQLKRNFNIEKQKIKSKSQKEVIQINSTSTEIINFEKAKEAIRKLKIASEKDPDSLEGYKYALAGMGVSFPESFIELDKINKQFQELRIRLKSAEFTVQERNELEKDVKLLSEILAPFEPL